MIAKACVRFVRISARKVRYVIDFIRKKRVGEAQRILVGSPRRAGDIIRKLLNQAVDAAEKNAHVPAENLYVSKVTADGGPTMKRFRAASMGRATTIRKRTSHIYLELDLTREALSSPKAKEPQTKRMAAEGRAPAKRTGKKLVGAK